MAADYPAHHPFMRESAQAAVAPIADSERMHDRQISGMAGRQK
jgi:hypothetical protein